MKARVLLLATVLVTAFACKKSNENEAVMPTPGPFGPTVNVQLKLTGDISTSESPLGRKITGVFENARSLRDSTLYSIVVSKDGRTIYEGLYNRADSITLKIPSSGSISVRAIAIGRGSGEGMSYTWYMGRQIFGNPFRTILTNKMDTVTSGYPRSTDTLTQLELYYDSETGDTLHSIVSLHSEADSYIGKVTFTASATPAVINVPMKRVVFGIKYNAANFSNGKLLVDYNGLMPPKSLTPAIAASKQFIYTADELQWGDSLYLNPVKVILSWEKPDGSTVTLGSKTIAFKRNVLTTINVTIPAANTSVKPILTDTTFTGNVNINF